MRGPKPPTIDLAAAERQELERLVRRHTTPQQLALRAQIVLAAADGANNCQIARQLDVSLDMVRRWRDRWRALQPASVDDLPLADRLTDAPRPGAPVRITAEQVAQIVALACAPPTDSQRPISQWTSREIADEIKQRGIVQQISGRHAACLLKRGL
jgi:putative transposase